MTCSLQELIARNISNPNTTSNMVIDDENHDPLEYAGGEFDVDEPAEVIQAVRISKAKVSGHSGGVHIIHYSN